ncbi:hypothetical protein CYY_002025 [Polysphondylium violaceum]|uniref:Uncharacterized protein n=1 Tax=Polysphondylium violaceum TaxID=133409 RepID=A0A8J4Q031_9MYCE|nr:hypothetical protein CYY_002025 [Polysphondylium violaceum]
MTIFGSLSKIGNPTKSITKGAIAGGLVSNPMDSDDIIANNHRKGGKMGGKRGKGNVNNVDIDNNVEINN